MIKDYPSQDPFCSWLEDELRGVFADIGSMRLTDEQLESWCSSRWVAIERARREALS